MEQLTERTVNVERVEDLIVVEATQQWRMQRRLLSKLRSTNC